MPIDAAARSAAAQRFDIEGSRVIVFMTAIGRPATLRANVRMGYLPAAVSDGVLQLQRLTFRTESH
jgi:hypothetical protein